MRTTKHAPLRTMVQDRQHAHGVPAIRPHGDGIGLSAASFLSSLKHSAYQDQVSHHSHQQEGRNSDLILITAYFILNSNPWASEILQLVGTFGSLIFTSSCSCGKKQLIIYKGTRGTFYDKMRLLKLHNFTCTKCKIPELKLRFCIAPTMDVTGK